MTVLLAVIIVLGLLVIVGSALALAGIFAIYSMENTGEICNKKEPGLHSLGSFLVFILIPEGRRTKTRKSKR